MTGHAPRDEVLLLRREVGNLFGGGGSGRPGPGGEFVDEVVACKDEFLGGDLAGGTEGGSMRNGGPFVAENVEGGADGLHGRRLEGLLELAKLAEGEGYAVVALLERSVCKIYVST